MNREAAGVGSWLLVEGLRAISVSLDEQAHHALDLESFARWQAEIHGADDKDAACAALPALLREMWRDELSSRERAVLRGLHLQGKSENAVAQALGIHHSAVGKIRRRAEGKLRNRLGYVFRYRELVEKRSAGQL